MKTTQTDDLYFRAVNGISAAQNASSDFDLNKDFEAPRRHDLREAGVLVLLTEVDSAWYVYLTKRSSVLKHHPGQIAFPGGKRDVEDANISETALREAREEIGLPRKAARVLGHLPNHETITGFSVTPVVAILEQTFKIIPEPGEVAEVFLTPLAHVLDPTSFSVQSRRWQGRQRHYYAVPYGPYYIWGATARILRGWADATS